MVSTTHAPSKLYLDRQILITPENEPMAKRLARIFFEDGPIAAIQEAEEKTHGQKNQLFVSRFVVRFDQSQAIQSADLAIH